MVKGSKPTWKVIDPGNVPEGSKDRVMYACMNCMREAELPIVGIAIAQIDTGLVFDTGKHSIPKVIECRKCRKRYELGV